MILFKYDLIRFLRFNSIFSILNKSAVRMFTFTKVNKGNEDFDPNSVWLSGSGKIKSNLI